MKSLICLAALLAALPAAAHAAPLRILDTIKVGGTGGWDYLTFDPVHQRVFIAHGTEVSSVDIATRTATVSLLATQGAHIALPVDGGNALLVTNGKSNLVTFNDAATGAEIARVATDAKPDAAIVDPQSGDAFVMANGGSAVDVIDLKSHAVSARIAVGGAPEAAAVDGAGLVFTHLEDKNAIVVIDARTRAVKATFALEDCDEPSGIAFVDKGRLLLSACKNGIARVSSADTGAEVATIAIGQRPDGVAYDAKAALGYIPTGDGQMTVVSFDGAPHVAEVMTTKPGARTLALDPASGHVFLPAADFTPPTKAGDRPGIVPDTFEILVVGR